MIFCKVVTKYETWLYQYDPEGKQQSKQWLPRGSSGPIKERSERSITKTMATIFWNSEGILLIYYQEGQRTINAIYYEQVLEKLHQAIKKKLRGNSMTKFCSTTITPRLIHHDWWGIKWEICDSNCSPTLLTVQI